MIASALHGAFAAPFRSRSRAEPIHRRTVDMTTKLEGELRREIVIGGMPYTLTITPDKVVLALKGRRKGLEIRWTDLVSGEAALARALNASLTANIAPAREDGPIATKAKGSKAKKV